MGDSMDRRAFLRTGVATAALGTVPWRATRAQATPIKIGLLAPLTGVVAAGGKELADGFQMYWEQIGGQVAGRKIEITVEDDASNPDTALQKARRLVEQ